MAMKIAFVHYHLKTGGVTTVLRHQINALAGRHETLVLTGDRAGARLPCPVVEISGLGYDRPGSAPVSSAEVADQTIAAIHKFWPTGCGILHVHNPTLAKNRQFLKILNHLRHAGMDLFLQIHDFAEDGRPACRFAEPYPPDCHYGVINRRDASFLVRAGLEEAGLHLLPNPVAPLPVIAGVTPKDRVLYPVRAIRRKNIGEAILLSLFFDPERRLAITQPPNSPADLAPYRTWVTWANRHGVPVDFAAGQTTDFARLVAAAPFAITTSIAEGFGYAYTEPWTVGLPVWGRRINNICIDIENKGVNLNNLYDHLKVPTVWFDRQQFSDQWQSTVVQAANAFGHRLETDQIAEALAKMTREGSIDFSILDERFQRQVLETLLRKRRHRNVLRQINPFLGAPATWLASASDIEQNRQLIARHYAVDGYRERLMDVYNQVKQRPIRQRIDKDALFASFFQLDRFSLLRWQTHG